MKKILLLLAMLMAFQSFAQVWVNSYTRSNGTHVKGYYRSSPNNTVRDNYSYKGNINPYTGKIGTNYYRNNPTSEYYKKLKPLYVSRKINAKNYNTQRYGIASRTLLERALNNRGYFPGKVDGIITDKTISAIKAIQRKYNLLVDGKVGKNTLRKLGLYTY